MTLTMPLAGYPLPLDYGDPVPAGRGRWRLYLQARQFTPAAEPVLVAELVGARSRRLEQVWDSAAKLTFTLDGRAPEAALIKELRTDVVAYRWDEPTGADVRIFRGIVAAAQDNLTEDAHTVAFTCWDYLKMLERRQMTTAVDWSTTPADQDTMVARFVQMATNASSASGVSLSPGSYLPIEVGYYGANYDDRPAGAGVPVRQRAYPAGTVLAQALDDLAKVDGGFDYDLLPGALGYPDHLRVFYPVQGITRPTPELAYGTTISSLARTVDSSTYANYCRVTGGSSDPTDAAAPPMFAEAWNDQANDVTVEPFGLWMANDNAADVIIQATLDEKAAGDLALEGLLVPSYTVNVRPGAYIYGSPRMGDVVPLLIKSGRLDVVSNARVLGIAYAIGDDGTEDIELTLGRTPLSFTKLVTQADRDVDALTRR
jgi:hypothetical protein